MDVLKSKSFWSSVAVIGAMFVVSIFPEFASNEEELTNAFMAIGIALVAGHKAKDVAIQFIEAWLNRTSLADELNELNEPAS